MIKNIALRVDANNNVGLGHLIRIKGFIFRNINIYQKFIIIVKGTKNIIAKNFSHKKIKIYYIKNPNIGGLKNILRILNYEKCEILISDISYKNNLLKKNFFKNYYNFFKNNKIMTVSFDDPRQKIYSDVSIIPYPLKPNFLRASKKSKILKGIRFTCFNKDLKRTKKRIKIVPKNILIALSGNKHNKISIKILKEILQLKLNIKIKLFSLKKINTKNIFLEKLPKKKIIFLDKINNMNSLLDWSDLIIIGEGLMRFEAAVKGVPSIFLNNVENTSKNTVLINQFLKLGSAFFVNLNDNKKNSFRIKFLKLYKSNLIRKRQSHNGFKKFDLNGAYRISRSINMHYRKAFNSLQR